jgi:Bacterial Ig domain
LDQFPSASLLADTLEGNGIIGNGGNGIQQTNFNPGLGSLEIFEPYIHESIEQGIYVTNPKAGVSPTTLSFINIKANVTTIEPSSFPKIASLEDNIIKVSTNNSTVSPITINKFPIEEAASHQRVLQVASNQIGHLAELPYTVGEIAVSKSSTKSDAGNFGRVFNANILENGSRKIDSNQFNSTSLIDPIVFPSLINSVTTQPDIRQDNVLKGSFPSVVSSQQIFSGNFSHDHTSLLNTIYSTAQTLWHIATPIDLTFNITNLSVGQLAEATITGYDKLGRPNTATISIDSDANGVGWFLDTTPQDNSEFNGIDNYFQATPNSAAYGKYDLLTTILHEMGHTLGIINGYSEFDKYVKGRQFSTDTFTANLTPDGSHLDTTFHPYDLMNTSLKPGVRKLPSTLNLAMIDALNSGIGSQESRIGGTITAPLTAGALLAINNGDFSTTADWNTAGATNIINGTATLTEQSQKLSELTQAFIIPTGARTLQFTIKDNHLIPGDTTKTANDAFEVALLDTNTFTPLAGTSIGLNHTDSLLNIQANGTIHKSDKVTITSLGNNSSIVTIDLTQITPTTQATLYFNLLGFGARTSTVTIDDVKLFTDTQPIPVTKNDTLNTNQNTPLTLDPTQLTTNDTNVTQIQIINQPTHGTLTQTPDGKFTYTPIPTYVGNDSFTYLGFGSDGQISNLATVNLTINNLPPTIQTLTIPTKINEGQNIQLSATAKDGGSCWGRWVSRLNPTYSSINVTVANEVQTS